MIESIVYGYIVLCGALPLAIGWRRGLTRRQMRAIAIAGLLFGWTGWGALLAWFNALTDDPQEDRTFLVIR